MIIFCDRMLKIDCDKPIVYFNLNSYYHGMIDASNLMPSGSLLESINSIDDLETQSFDNRYANEIMSNDNKFGTLATIISFLYSNPDGIAIILIENSPFRDAIKESLIKFIQVRYGLQSYSVEDENDFNYLIEQIRYTNNFDGVDCIFNMTGDLLRHMETNPQLYLKE